MTRGKTGVASAFLWGSFIRYNVPVYPGALCLFNSGILVISLDAGMPLGVYLPGHEARKSDPDERGGLIECST